jgi:hypothetical protein
VANLMLEGPPCSTSSLANLCCSTQAPNQVKMERNGAGANSLRHYSCPRTGVRGTWLWLATRPRRLECAFHSMLVPPPPTTTLSQGWPEPLCRACAPYESAPSVTWVLTPACDTGLPS